MAVIGRWTNLKFLLFFVISSLVLFGFIVLPVPKIEFNYEDASLSSSDELLQFLSRQNTSSNASTLNSTFSSSTSSVASSDWTFIPYENKTKSSCKCFTRDVSVQKFLSTSTLTLTSSTSNDSNNNFVVPCPMTINVIGRLGNVMGQYATLWAFSLLNGRPAFQRRSMFDELSPFFPGLSMNVMNETVFDRISWTSHWVHDWMSDEYSRFDCHFTKITGYPCSWTFFHRFRDDIKREFTFSPQIVRDVQDQLHAFANSRLPRVKTVTYVGVHVRRGDYVKLMQTLYDGVLADRYYLSKAMNHFRNKYPRCLFVVCSDDLDWCKKNIDAKTHEDVMFCWNGTASSPGRDMALLTQCNHTVMSMGTFGFWTAYLTGGDVVYLNNYTRPGSKFHDVFHYDAAYLPEWEGIVADLNSTAWI